MNDPEGFVKLHDRMGFEIYLRADCVTAVVNTGTLVQVAVMGMNEPLKIKEDFNEIIAKLTEALG